MCIRSMLSLVLFLGVALLCAADTVVQLNVNRPFNDVSENFVSFALKPEELYEALDGPNRKFVTTMATMLGDSYLKLIGVYQFPAKKLRAPIKIIWKGFNHWTRAVNWTMIIPLPYSDNHWDTMQTLKILNTSYALGITNCIWQMGNDISAPSVKEYISELGTLKLMVDTFRPYVDDWRVIGGDLSTGNSVEDVKVFLDMSKNISSSFTWNQPGNMLPASSLGSYLYESDPALRILLASRSRVWLYLSEDTDDLIHSIGKPLIKDETTDGLRWAQTLGDAASSGFDVIFKRIKLANWERPNYTFYITTLFKKVMGSRVFPARPLNIFSPTNKLYTHCANAVSGGIAFMVVNTENKPLTITVRSLSKLTTSEVWQYTLINDDNKVLLNNVKVSLSSSLSPKISVKSPDKPLQLVAPTLSVSFWVLPTVNIEHCQFTEVEEDSQNEEGTLEREYSSSDRLLQQLIEQTSLSRVRRSSFENHFDKKTNIGKLEKHSNMVSKMQKPVKVAAASYNVTTEPSLPLLNLKTDNSIGILRRRTRSMEDYLTSPFLNKRRKKAAFIRKITEIRRPEKKVKPLFDFTEFNEEEFFKKLHEKPEPEYRGPPEGDVHLKLVDTINAEEDDTIDKPSLEVPDKKININRSKETDFISLDEETNLESQLSDAETLPNLKKKNINIGEALNLLLYPEPFSKTRTNPYKEIIEHITEAVTKVENNKYHKTGNLAESFLHSQKELAKHFLNVINSKGHEEQAESEEDEVRTEKDVETKTTIYEMTTEASPLPKTFELKKESLKALSEIEAIPKTRSLKQKVLQKRKNKNRLVERKTWWDSAGARKKRSVPIILSEDAIRANTIDKEDSMSPLGSTHSKEFQFFEYEIKNTYPPPYVKDPTVEKLVPSEERIDKLDNVTFTDKLMSVVKTNVSKFMNIFTRHVNEWYNTLTKRTEETEETTTMGNNIK